LEVYLKAELVEVVQKPPD